MQPLRERPVVAGMHARFVAGKARLKQLPHCPRGRNFSFGSRVENGRSKGADREGLAGIATYIASSGGSRETSISAHQGAIGR